MRVLARDRVKFALLSGLGLLTACSDRSSGGGNDAGRTATPGSGDAATSLSSARSSVSSSEAGAPLEAGLSAGTSSQSLSSPLPSLSSATGTATADGGDASDAGDASAADASDAGNSNAADAGDAADSGDAADANQGAAMCRAEPSGLSYCTSGAIHRVHGPMCDSQLPRASTPLPHFDAGAAASAADAAIEAGTDAGVRYDFQCTADSDCQQRAHGYCEAFSVTDEWLLGGMAPLHGSACQYGCRVDSDCGENYACQCGALIGECVPATCRTDAECADGEGCFQYSYFDGCANRLGYQCSSPADECLANQDCGDLACGISFMTGARACEAENCSIGRPFLVNECERVAELEVRDDWMVSLDAGPIVAAGISKQVAQAWRRIGLMEHASVAAFARFSLQLLGLGAPVELVRAATQAMADETRHAELAFGLARHFDGCAVGPGPLRMDGVLSETTLEQVVVAAVREGCIGETVATLEAAEAREATHHEPVARVLSTIEQDEGRHALLAWRFLQWALSREPALEQTVRRVLKEELQRALAVEPAATEPDLSAFGVASARQRQQRRREVLQSIVLPTFERMMHVGAAITPSETPPGRPAGSSQRCA